MQEVSKTFFCNRNKKYEKKVYIPVSMQHHNTQLNTSQA